MSDREPWGDETDEPMIPDATGEEYVEWRERVRGDDDECEREDDDADDE